MKNLARLFGACLLLVIISLFAMKGWDSYFALEPSSADNASNNTPAEQTEATKYTVDSAALDEIQTVINKYSNTLDISVSVTDLQTGKAYHYGDTAGFTAASVGKLVTAATFLHEVDNDAASLSQSVGGTTAQEELRLMLVESDNTAWHNMEMAVTLSAQQAYAESIGLASYDAESNTVSSDDIAKLLTKLAQGTLFADQYTQIMLGYMQQANYRGYIVAAVPDDVTVYHKVGLLEDRVHDAAIIKKDDRSYVLVVFSKTAGAYDFSKASPLFGSITNATLKAFLGISS
jgi:beta-lactamase class A